MNDEHLLQSLKTTTEDLKNTADSLEKTATLLHQSVQSCLERLKKKEKIMKVKDLTEKLQEFPEDMEVLINYGELYDGEIIVNRKNLYHCNSTSKWQSNFDFYSEYDEPCVYKDEVDGKIVVMKVPTEKKEFIVLDC